MVKVNATFNAYLLPRIPPVVQETKSLIMIRHLTLDEDMKEYWGFYLLKGSTVTISTCVRYAFLEWTVAFPTTLCDGGLV